MSLSVPSKNVSHSNVFALIVLTFFLIKTSFVCFVYQSSQNCNQTCQFKLKLKKKNHQFHKSLTKYIHKPLIQISCLIYIEQ